MQKRDKNNKIIRKPKVTFIKHPIIDKCKPCVLHDNSVCEIYLFPSLKWKLGDCPMIKENKFRRKIK